MRAMRSVALGALGALAACGGDPDTCRLAVRFAAQPQPVAALELSAGSVEIENLTVLEDGAPGVRSALFEFDLGVIGAARTLAFELPPAAYAGVRFVVDQLALQGSWRGAPLQIQLENVGAVVELRPAAGLALRAGQQRQLGVVLDAGAWFGDALLDAAAPAGGVIAIDAADNQALAPTLAARVPASFSLDDAVDASH